MEKQILFQRLQNEVEALVKAVENIPEADFFQQPHAEKWSIGQNVQHLIQASKPLVKLFGQPSLMEQWGKSPHPTRTYEEIKTLYDNALSQPQPLLQSYRHIDTEGSKEELLETLKSVTAKLIERAAMLSETDLDTYQMPHPLKFMLTAGEFLHFTAYHTRHHHDIVSKIVVNK
ncbi:MAG: DinB family protein [Saprospiraceae bacterium]|nr:DinB family protein [Saprospiraceae bacterium]